MTTMQARLFRALRPEPEPPLAWVNDREWSFPDPGGTESLAAALTNLWSIRDLLGADGEPLTDGDVVVIGWGNPWVKAFEWDDDDVSFVPTALPTIHRVTNWVELAGWKHH